VTQGQPQPLTLDAHGDEPDAGPGVEPAVQELQRGLTGRELEEAEGGAERGESSVVGGLHRRGRGNAANGPCGRALRLTEAFEDVGQEVSFDPTPSTSRGGLGWAPAGPIAVGVPPEDPPAARRGGTVPQGQLTSRGVDALRPLLTVTDERAR